MRPVYFHNTLTRRKQEFSPIRPGEVGMYTCGPTVYQCASIGNLRSYVFSDVLRRTLEYNGLRVTQVMNVTDVGHLVSDADEGEDKMMVSAAQERKSPWEIAAQYTRAFVKDAARLNIEPPTVFTPATHHIPEMIAMVQKLLDNGYAYETGDGIYFDISRFPEYGKLSGISLEDQLAGARVEVRGEKRHPADFALWKKAPEEHIMQWESPWGMGYPGWHIECSAISRAYLGDQFDIHTGGVDHIPIHHENEIAQSQACTGKVPARFWMHGEFLQVDGGRMGKSLGNTYTLDDLAAKGFEPLSFRYFCFSAHYRSKLNFTWSALASAQNGLRSLRRLVQKSAGLPEPEGAGKRYEEWLGRFSEAVSDDLNLPRAVAVLWDAARDDLGPKLLVLAGEFDRVLALDLPTGKAREDEAAIEAPDLPDEVHRLLEERAAARQGKDWAKSDEIREKLRKMGYAVKDTKAGYEVTRIPA